MDIYYRNFRVGLVIYLVKYIYKVNKRGERERERIGSSCFSFVFVVGEDYLGYEYLLLWTWENFGDYV